MFCQNKIDSTKLKQMTKRWKVEPVKAKNLMQTSAKFCEVFALELPPFFVQNSSALLSVVQVLLSFAAPPNLHCVLFICERKKVEKNITSDPGS